MKKYVDRDKLQEYTGKLTDKHKTLFPKQYQTISDLLADSKLKNGMWCKTAGYYAANDGGGALYYISNSAGTNEYYETAENGLLAILINENGTVEASQFGVIGTNATSTRVNAAIQTASKLKFNLRFGRDFTTSDSVIISSGFANKTVYFDCVVTYTGTDAAIIINSLSHGEIKGKVISAVNGIGIEYLQNGNSLIYATNIDFTYINANIGVYLRSETWGILDSTIKIGEIRSKSDGIKGECIDPGSGAPHPTYIGHMTYDVQLITAKGYAVNFITYATGSDGSTVTGAYFGNISFEGSSNGIRCSGDCKLIHIENLRVFEQASFTNVVEMSGNIRYVYIHTSSPVYYSKISVSTTHSIFSNPIIIDGGIWSPTSFKFAEKMIVGSQGETFFTDKTFKFTRNTDWTFLDESSTTYGWRCVSYFNVTTSNRNVKLKNMKYFSPYGGIDTIYLNMNTSSGAVFSIYDANDTLLFDGSTLPSEDRALYRVKIYYDVGNDKLAVSVTKQNAASDTLITN